MSALMLVACLILIFCLAVSVRFHFRAVTDERLLGTWKSDADRTIAHRRETRTVTDRQEAALRKLFGKMRITYSETAYTTEFEGVTQTMRYRAVGSDRVSAVIRDLEPDPILAELSRFTIIYFEEADVYSVTTSLGDFREYFQRVK